MLGVRGPIERLGDRLFEATWVQGGLAQGVLVKLFRAGPGVAEGEGIERPAGVYVLFSEVNVALGIWRGNRRAAHHQHGGDGCVAQGTYVAPLHRSTPFQFDGVLLVHKRRIVYQPAGLMRAVSWRRPRRM